MDNKIRAELDKMLEANGLDLYDGLMVAKFGGETGQFKPYLLAAALELSYITLATTLDGIDDGAGLLMAKVQNDALIPMVIAAGEAVGVDWKARSGRSDDAILDVEVVE